MENQPTQSGGQIPAVVSDVLSGSLRELREKVSSSRKPGDTDPTPEQWRGFVATWDDAFLLKWVEFTENPPDAWKQLAALSRDA